MPTPIYYFQVRGRSISGAHRFDTKDKAEAIYAAFNDAIKAGEEFVSVTIDDQVNAIRAADISAFGISVSFEETPEERKARLESEIKRRVENDLQYNECGMQPAGRINAIGGLLGNA